MTLQNNVVINETPKTTNLANVFGFPIESDDTSCTLPIIVNGMTLHAILNTSVRVSLFNHDIWQMWVAKKL